MDILKDYLLFEHIVVTWAAVHSISPEIVPVEHSQSLLEEIDKLYVWQWLQKIKESWDTIVWRWVMNLAFELKDENWETKIERNDTMVEKVILVKPLNSILNQHGKLAINSWNEEVHWWESESSSSNQWEEVSEGWVPTNDDESTWV